MQNLKKIIKSEITSKSSYIILDVIITLTQLHSGLHELFFILLNTRETFHVPIVDSLIAFHLSNSLPHSLSLSLSLNL